MHIEISWDWQILHIRVLGNDYVTLSLLSRDCIALSLLVQLQMDYWLLKLPHASQPFYRLLALEFFLWNSFASGYLPLGFTRNTGIYCAKKCNTEGLEKSTVLNINLILFVCWRLHVSPVEGLFVLFTTTNFFLSHPHLGLPLADSNLISSWKFRN